MLTWGIAQNCWIREVKKIASEAWLTGTMVRVGCGSLTSKSGYGLLKKRKWKQDMLVNMTQETTQCWERNLCPPTLFGKCFMIVVADRCYPDTSKLGFSFLFVCVCVCVCVCVWHLRDTSWRLQWHSSHKILCNFGGLFVRCQERLPLAEVKIFVIEMWSNWMFETNSCGE